MKLALGTVQFGLDYGVANASGQVPVDEVRRILALARESGVDTLDTAAAYGESEAVLGAAGAGDFRLVTKISPHGGGGSHAMAVRESLLRSLHRLAC
ncbi:MAG: aldo/keto reductase [Arhodomonas sp.]|nr:aldo/keto reductase [Arhodomonas sp.]